MKRWLDDPDQAAAARVLAPLAEPHAVDPGARARGWQAVEQRTIAGAARVRRVRLGVMVIAIVVAGTAAGKVLLRDDSPVHEPDPATTLPAPAPLAVTVPGTVSVPVPAPVTVPIPVPEAETVPATMPPATTARPQLRSPRPAPVPASAAEAAPEPAGPAPAPAAPDAELAAYRAARVAMRTDLADGLARLRAFLAAYPGGRFDAEARLSIIECELRLGRLAEAEPDVGAFLVRFPDSERAAEVRFVRAEIQRRVHGRCDLALADYRAAATSARVGDDARRLLDHCADSIRQPR